LTRTLIWPFDHDATSRSGDASPRFCIRVNAALLAGNRDVLAQDETRKHGVPMI
jgi:hypothetical protein